MKTKTEVIISVIFAAFLISFSNLVFASKYYNHRLCDRSDYVCIKIKKGDTWAKLFPNARERGIVMRVNRTNMRLRPGKIVAIPNNLQRLDIMHFSPFASRINPPYRTVLIFDLSDHAFAAYDEQGRLIHWGPFAGGNSWCADVRRSCRTPTGTFYVKSKGGPGCISSKYPIPRGGAPMAYCMFFYGGYAIHASYLPGYHASHGCIRLFYDDAKWLNREFVHLGNNRTKVIVRR